MQLLFDESDEFGATRGLGLLRGRVRRFENDLVVPHVGWNRIHQKRPHALFDGIADGSFCYFVHSFYCEPQMKPLSRERLNMVRDTLQLLRRGIFAVCSFIRRRVRTSDCGC